MKKIIVLILLILFSLPAFAEYKPIPKDKQAQYKIEVEEIINKEYLIIIKNIDDSVNNAKRLHDKMFKNGFNLDDYILLSLIPETNIPSADLDLYSNLLKLTQEKYLGIKYEPPGTDSVNIFDDILSVYLKKYNINKNKLNKIIIYKNKKIKIVEKYIKDIEEIKPNI